MWGRFNRKVKSVADSRSIIESKNFIIYIAGYDSICVCLLLVWTYESGGGPLS